MLARRGSTGERHTQAPRALPRPMTCTVERHEGALLDADAAAGPRRRHPSVVDVVRRRRPSTPFDAARGRKAAFGARTISGKLPGTKDSLTDRQDACHYRSSPVVPTSEVAPMSQPLLLVGVGDDAAHTEFALAQIAAAHPVVLADAHVPAWARAHLDGHLPLDPTDEAAVLETVRRFASIHDVGGVVGCLGEHPVTASRIARQLGLPGNSPQAMAVCADPVAGRRALAEHGVPVARWARTDSERGVVASADALIDGQPQGQKVAAETVVRDGDDIHIVAITRTVHGPPCAVRAVRHSVYAHDPLLHHRLLRQAVTRAVQALGSTLGVFHVEILLTSRGPHILHVGPRLAGDLIPLLVKRATGISLPQVAADLAAGSLPDLLPSRQRAAAAHFASAEEPCTKDGLAHRVVVGATAGDCHAALDRMAHDPSVSVTSSTAAGARV